MSVQRRTLEENVELATVLAQKNGGKIPAPSWLRRNGYVGLYQSILAHSTAYSKLRRETTRMSYDLKRKNAQERHLQKAKKLARVIKGRYVLPSREYLRAKGMGSMVAYITKYPQQFPAFVFDDSNGTYVSWTTRKEQLLQIIANNKGKLPPTMTLINQYGTGLYKALCRHRKEFVNVEQEKSS